MEPAICNPILEVQFCPSVASTEFYELLIQFGINLFVLLIISRVIYLKWNHRPEYMFAQLITGIVVFMICALLRWVKLELGIVLGLFAIFAIIRFRTINVPVKEMAYLFMVVGISAVNALLEIGLCYQWVILSNSILLGMALIMEQAYFSKRLSVRSITYQNTDMLKPGQQPLLLQELKDLTGLDIIRFEIGKVDYVKKNAQIRIYFTGEGTGKPSEGETGNDDD